MDVSISHDPFAPEPVAKATGRKSRKHKAPQAAQEHAPDAPDTEPKGSDVQPDADDTGPHDEPTIDTESETD